MPIDIVVCIKQVPHPDHMARISFDPTRGTIGREGVPCAINPGDRNAIEEALKIRERFTGSITVMTMGPPQAKEALEEALAMDIDAAIHLCDRAFAGADTLATAWTLSYGINKLGRFDLILCGNTTSDSGTGQVALQLAEFLKLPCTTDTEELTLEDEQNLIAKRSWERGHIKLRIQLPAVIAVTDKINQPRLPNILGIMAATQKEITEWNAEDIKADINRVGLNGSPTRFYQMSEFHAERQGETFSGSPEEAVSSAIDKLKKQDIL